MRVKCLAKAWRIAAVLAAGLVWLTGCGEPGRAGEAPAAEKSAAVSAAASAPSDLVETTSTAASSTAASGTAGDEKPASALPRPAAADSLPEQDLSTTDGARVIVRGRVLNSDQSPAGGASLSLLHFSPSSREGQPMRPRVVDTTSATAEGKFELRSSETEQIFLKAGAPERVTVESYIDVKRLSSASGSTGVLLLEPEVVLPDAAALRGRVRDDQGRPVPQVMVALMTTPPLHLLGAGEGLRRLRTIAPSQQTTSSAQGEFAFEAVAAGTLELWCRVPGYLPVRKEVTAPAEGVELVLGTGGATVEGAVYSEETREGVPGATVDLQLKAPLEPMVPGKSYRLNPPAVPQVVTDAAGSFRFTQVTPGSYLLSARKDGQYSAPQDPTDGLLPVREDETTNGLALFLSPGLTVSGRVTEQLTKRPMEGVAVVAWNRSDRSETSATTDADGRYELRDLPSPTRYGLGLKVIKEGWQVTGPIREMGGQVALKPDPGEKNVTADMEMTPLTELRGRVIGESGKGIRGAEVRINVLPDSPSFLPTSELKTDAEGQFRIESLPEVRFYAVAKAPGYAPARSESAETGLGFQDLVIRLKLGMSVSGHVEDPAGKPVEGAEVTMTANVRDGEETYHVESGEVTTDGEGRFVFANLPEGEVSLNARKEGFAASTWTKVSLGQEGGKEVLLQLRKAHFLAGRVTDSAGKPIADASVRANSQTPDVSGSGEARTDQEGKYRIENIPQAVYWVGGSALEYRNESINGAESGREDVDFRLSAGSKEVRSDTADSRGKGELSGRVVKGRAGVPLAEAAVYVAPLNYYWEGWQRNAVAQTRTAMDGTFHLKEVPAGTYDLAVMPAGAKDETRRNVTVKEGEAGELGDVRVPDPSSVRIKVVREPDGSGVADTALHLTWFKNNSAGSPSHRERTGADGSYRFTELQPGKYSVSAPDLKLSKSFTLEEESAQEVVLKTGGATLQGQVTWRGKPARTTLWMREDAKWDEQMKVMSLYSESDAEGKYEVPNLAPGRWQITLRPAEMEEDYVDFPEAVDVPSEGVVVKNVAFPGGVITGRMLDAEERPVFDARVSLSRVPGEIQYNHPSRSGVKTRSDGTFRIKMVHPGTWMVHGKSANGATAKPEEVVISGDTDAEVTLQIRKDGGAAVVTVRGEDGKVPSWVSVSLYSVGPARQLVAGDTPGEYRLSGIPPGKYTAHIMATDYVRSETPVEIVEGETLRLEKVLPRAGSLQWTLLGKDDRPLRNQKVSYVLEPNSPAGAQTISGTDEQGHMKIEGLAAGPYVITATVSDQGKLTEAFDIEAGEMTIMQSKLE